MKYYKFTYLLLLFMLIGISCEVSNVELASKDASSLSVDHRTETEENREHPAEVPSADSWIMLAFNDTEINWKDVDNWYTNELPKWAEKPEYHNMKSLAISCLVVAKPAFLIEAEREKLLYFLTLTV